MGCCFAFVEVVVAMRDIAGKNGFVVVRVVGVMVVVVVEDGWWRRVEVEERLFCGCRCDLK